MISGSGNKTCISNISYCQTINYLEEYPDKIKIKIQTISITDIIHSVLRLRIMDSVCYYNEEDSSL